MNSPAVFLDRDGVLNDLVPDPVSGLPESPLDPSDVLLLPGVVEALKRLRGAGYALVGVTNQPAAAKGLVTLERLNEVQARVVGLLAEQDVGFDRFAVCPHHPAGLVPSLTRRCSCRKPAPGMLLDAIREVGLRADASWMVGDSDDDVAAGLAAGVQPILVENPASAHRRSAGDATIATVVDLPAAVELILRDTR